MNKEERMEKTRNEYTPTYTRRDLKYLTKENVESIIELYPNHTIREMSDKLKLNSNQVNTLIHHLLKREVIVKKSSKESFDKIFTRILEEIKNK